MQTDTTHAPGRAARRWMAAVTASVLALSGLVVAVGGLVLAATPAASAPTAQTCSYAPANQGPFARTLCWLDMSDYSDSAAGSASGQEMVLQLPGGYRMTYTLLRSGRQIASSPLPIIATAFIGNTGGYSGVAGQPGLYQVNRAVDPATSSTLRMTDIAMTDAGGNPVTGFSIVGVDAEQTTTGESDTWTSDVPMDQLIPHGNSCNSAFTGVGTTTVFCSSDNTANRTGTAMLAAQAPTFMTQRMQNAPTGRQGVAFAVLVSKVRLDKVVDGRLDPADSFTLGVTSPEGHPLALAGTGTTTTGTTGEVETISTTADSTFTLSESSAPSDLSVYSGSWSCTRNGSPDPRLPSGEAGPSAPVTVKTGDLVACTVTNRARPATLTLQKVAGAPEDVNADGITDAGDTIGYTFEVKNTGELALEGVAVDDPVLGAVVCPSTQLAAGQTMVCSGVTDHVVTAEEASRRHLLNVAVARGTPEGTAVTVVSNTSATDTPLDVAEPSLRLDKTASPGSVSTAGESVQYSFEVVNTGNVPVGDIGVSELQFTGTGAPLQVFCPPVVLGPGGQATCVASYALTQSDIDAGRVDNKAVATGTADGPVTSEPSSAEVLVPAEPSLLLTKSVAPNDAASFVVGQPLTYTFAVVNTGNVTVTGVSITEQAFSGSGTLSAIDCGPQAVSLAPGDQTTCSAAYTVTQADVDTGRLDNTAVASGTAAGGGAVTSQEASTTLPADLAPSLTLLKSADPSTASAAGTTIDYTFAVTNTGNVTVTGVDVTETQFSGSGPAPTIVCPPTAPLLPGATLTCSASYVTTQADVDSGTLSNSASASATAPDGAPVDATASAVVVDLVPVRSLALLKSASPTQVSAAGDVVDFSFLVTNTGTVTMSSVTVTETDFSGDGPLAVVCPPGAASLAPGADVTCAASYTVTQADLDRGFVTNTAFASGTPAGGGEAVESELSTVALPAAAVPNLTIIKTASVPTVSADGDLIGYSFTVTNTGNVTLSDVRIVDGVFTGVGAPLAPLCPPGAASLAPGASVVCTAVAAVTQVDIDAGVVSNTASALGNPPQGGAPVVSPPSTVHVQAVSAPAVTVEKQATPTVVTAAGQQVAYSFLVTNSGNVTLSGIEVVEGTFSGAGPGPVAVCPAEAASLSSGASVTCSASYTATQADVDAGGVTNTATAHGLPPRAEAPVVSVPAEATVTAVAAPSLSLLKTVNRLTYVPGQSATYTFVVTNTGNLTMDDVGVDEVTFTGTGPVPVVMCPAARSLAPAQTLTCSAEYLTTSADAGAGHTDNIARATGVADGPTGQPVASGLSAAVMQATLVPPAPPGPESPAPTAPAASAPSPAASGARQADLPSTGADLRAFAATWVLLLLGAGVGMRAVARRRRLSPSE